MSGAKAGISYQEEDKPLHAWLSLREVSVTSLANKSPNKGKNVQNYIIFEQKTHVMLNTDLKLAKVNLA